MSAYSLNDYTLNMLIAYGHLNKAHIYTNRTHDIESPEDCQRLATVLRWENDRSLRARYEERADEYFGEPESIRFVFPAEARTVDPVAMLKACNCYDYQACESDDYKTTLAHAIVDAIRHAAIRRLPGYEDGPGWGFNEPENAQPDPYFDAPKLSDIPDGAKPEPGRIYRLI